MYRVRLVAFSVFSVICTILAPSLWLHQSSMAQTVRITNGIGVPQNIPTSSGSASIILPTPKGNESFVFIVYSDPYFPDVKNARGMFNEIVFIPSPTDLLSYNNNNYQLEINGHKFSLRLSKSSGKVDWQNPLAINPYNWQDSAIDKVLNKKDFERTRQEKLKKLLVSEIEPLPINNAGIFEQVSVAVPPVLVPVPVPIKPSEEHNTLDVVNQEEGSLATVSVQEKASLNPITIEEVEHSMESGESDHQRENQSGSNVAEVQQAESQNLQGDPELSQDNASTEVYSLNEETFFIDVTGLPIENKWHDEILEEGGRQAIVHKASLVRPGVYVDIYVDKAANGMDAAILDTLAYNIENVILPRDILVFGQTTDVDKNGKIIVLLTPVINNSPAVGFTNLADLFPKKVNENDPSLSQNPFSNQAEMFYTFVPKRMERINILLATMAHELHHLIYFGNRVVNPTARQSFASMPSTWFTEALAYLAEDLSGYGSEPSGPKQLALLGLLSMPNVSLTASNIFESFDVGDLGNEDSSHRRGLGYLFIRYLFDRKGGIDISSNGSIIDKGGISWLHKVFKYPGINEEMRAIEKVSGRPFSRLLADWYSALILDGSSLFSSGKTKYNPPLIDPLSGHEIGIRIYGPNDTGLESEGGFGMVNFVGPYVRRLESATRNTIIMDRANPVFSMPAGMIFPMSLPVFPNVIPTSAASYFQYNATHGSKEVNVVFSTDTPYPLSVLVIRLQ